MSQPAPNPSELILYQTEDGRTRLEVRLVRAGTKPQAGGLPEISRGLSASDTPGSRAQSPAPRRGARPAASGSGCDPFRVVDSLTQSGGVVAALLNPRLISVIASRWRCMWPAPNPSELILHQTEDGRTRLVVRLREFIVKALTLQNRSSRREVAHFGTRLRWSLLTPAATQ